MTRERPLAAGHCWIRLGAPASVVATRGGHPLPASRPARRLIRAVGGGTAMRRVCLGARSAPVVRAGWRWPLIRLSWRALTLRVLGSTGSLGQASRFDRRRRQRRGRVRLVASVVVLAVLAPVVYSYTTTMMQPSSLPLWPRSVEWLRAHHGNWLVDEVEHYYYSWKAPKKGGPQLTSLPGIGLPVSRLPPKPAPHGVRAARRRGTGWRLAAADQACLRASAAR